MTMPICGIAMVPGFRRPKRVTFCTRGSKLDDGVIRFD